MFRVRHPASLTFIDLLIHISTALKLWPAALGAGLSWFIPESCVFLKLLFQRVTLRSCDPHMIF